MAVSTHLAFDLGATSGRAILGRVDGDHLTLTDIHRFPNAMQKDQEHSFWNTTLLFREIQSGIALARAASRTTPIDTIGVDTWGVDFGLLDANGQLCRMPIAYRDPYTDGIMDEVFGTVPRAEVYTRTGIQFLQFNSLYQLFALRKFHPRILEHASALLFMPDLINHFLTGRVRTEYTIASTSQLLHAAWRTWDWQLIRSLGFPERLFQPIIHPASDIGALRPELRGGPRSRKRVCAVASHDTASAVVAVPSLTPNFAYLSSGTWSLMGIETHAPIITEQTIDRNFTNEGGTDGTFRVLKNITGMWLLEECRRLWNAVENSSYEKLIEAALDEAPFAALIDPDDPAFAHPASMIDAIRCACVRNEQCEVVRPGAVTRVIFESLALKYRSVLDELRTISPHPIDVLHVIGGGARNALLCQWTADACGIPVIAGPAEATAVGNILMQARSMGAFETPGAMRQAVINSFSPVTYVPATTERWNDAYRRFTELYHHP